MSSLRIVDHGLTLRLAPSPVLSMPTRLVNDVDAAVEQMLEGMAHLMYESRGIGLAANQAGISLRMFVFDIGWLNHLPRKPKAVINPFIKSHGPLHKHSEGCLSLPDQGFAVVRPKWVEIQYQDGEGKVRRERWRGLKAACACHEIDHLDGILLTERAQARI